MASDSYPGPSDAHPAAHDLPGKTTSVARAAGVVVTAIVLVAVFALLALGAIKQANTLRASPSPTANGR